jgi:hypothetical protein
VSSLVTRIILGYAVLCNVNYIKVKALRLQRIQIISMDFALTPNDLISKLHYSDDLAFLMDIMPSISDYVNKLQFFAR